MNLSFKHFHKAIKSSLIAMIVATPLSVNALDLPIKNINGTQYYFREVKPKETIYGLCRELGLTKDEIVRHNPAVGDGLKAGMTLYFPVSEYKSDNNAPAQSKAIDNGTPKVIETADAHIVEKGETIYGISRHYGVSEEDLIAANPNIKNGLKAGMLVNIPSANTNSPENDRMTTVSTIIPNPVPATQTSPISMPERNYDFPTDKETERDNKIFLSDNDIETETEIDEIEDKPVKIAVILPFMLNRDSNDKQTLLYTEFFKGMLLAADSLKNNKTQIELNAYDSEDNTNTIKSIISNPEFNGTDIIIAPDNDQQLALLSNYADTASSTILNIFAVKNTDYLSNPKIMQANIPHSNMYEQAVKSFMEEFDGYIPVILTSNEGKHDKDEFVNLLKYQLTKNGKTFEIIDYNGYLKSSDFSTLKGNENKYVFVPVSGSATEFNHIISALKKYRESSSDYNSVRLFGYPEWITFRGDALENLHAMNATIYSRFYNDSSDPRSKNISEKYVRFYGAPMMAAVPVQGILGFDTGYFLLSAIDKDMNLIDGNNFYDGIQSGFHFIKHDDAQGKVNDLLYFVNFRPSGMIDKRVLQ